MRSSPLPTAVLIQIHRYDWTVTGMVIFSSDPKDKEAKRMRTGTTAIFTRLLAALMAILLLATYVGAALAEDDGITYDGITYYNVDEADFASPSIFYPALLNAILDEDGYSMAERWLQVMIGYYFGRYKGGDKL